MRVAEVGLEKPRRDLQVVQHYHTRHFAQFFDDPATFVGQRSALASKSVDAPVASIPRLLSALAVCSLSCLPADIQALNYGGGLEVGSALEQDLDPKLVERNCT